MFEYNVRVVEIVDGDTLKLEVDLGFTVKVQTTFRLARINCPELLSVEGVAAKLFVVDELNKAKAFKIQSTRREKFGRWLCEFFYQTGDKRSPWHNLNDLLLKSGQARLYRHR